MGGSVDVTAVSGCTCRGSLWGKPAHAFYEPSGVLRLQGGMGVGADARSSTLGALCQPSNPGMQDRQLVPCQLAPAGLSRRRPAIFGLQHTPHCLMQQRP